MIDSYNRENNRSEFKVQIHTEDSEAQQTDLLERSWRRQKAFLEVKVKL